MSQEKIKIISDIESIQNSPGMYIGNTHNPNHLFHEVLDNCLDQMIAGYASNINIESISNDHIIVTDNGNGIPDHDVVVPETNKIENSILAAITRTKSGSKFDKNSNRLSIGLHGFGLAAVNALSLYTRVSVLNKTTNIIHDFIFEKSQLIKEDFLNNEDLKYTWTTRLEFKIDPKYFTIPNFEFDSIYSRLKLVKSIYDCNIIVNNNELFLQNPEEFIREELNINNDIKLFKIDFNYNETFLRFYFTYDLTSTSNPYIVGNVNLRPCSGTYLTNISSVFNNVIKNKYSNLVNNEGLSYFKCYINLFTPNPTFSSQSKGEMTKGIRSQLNGLENTILDIIKDKYIDDCIKYIIESKSLKKANKSIKTNSKRASAANPLKDCLNSPGDVLYIVEGTSAGGTLAGFRYHKTEAILELRGKILNVVNATVSDIQKNKVIKYLFEAIGVDLSDIKNQIKYRYQYIKILCDADPDGMHIAVLTVLAIWKYAPNLIKQKRLSIILPPLYTANVNGKYIPIKNEEDVKNYLPSQIHRNKGLGEMEENELEPVIRQGMEYWLLPPQNKTELESIEACISETEVKRELCRMTEVFNISNILKLIK